MRSTGTRSHDLRHVEDRVRQVGSATHEAGEDAGVEPERVEVGVDDQVAVAGPHTDNFTPRVVALAYGTVDQHCAFREPVVPDVNMMWQRSSPVTESERCAQLGRR